MSEDTSLGSIFSSATAGKIEVLYDKIKNSGLVDPVGTGAFAVSPLKVDTSTNPKLNIFDLTANLGASASAQVTINAASAQISPFDPASGVTAPAGSSYAQLHVQGDLEAGVAGTPAAPVSVSAAASATFAYDNYLPVAATAIRGPALLKMVSTAQLPEFASLTTLAPGQVCRFEADLKFDLGIKAKYGQSFDFSRVLDLFSGLSAQLTAQVQYSIEANLGWSVYETMSLTVGAVQQNNPGWVRVRIDRLNKNTLAAGATFSLQVAYDASSIGTALEKAFKMSPLPRVMSVLNVVAAGNWDVIKGQITDLAANDLIAAIAGTGWKEKAASDPVVVQALAAINKTVSIYNQIGPKVQQIWSDLLTKVDLQPGSPIRKTIDTIAGLDPKNPNLQQFLSPTAQKDLAMLESLSGKSIEQLIVGSNAEISIAIGQAIKLAQQLQRVITGTPTEINNAIQTFAKDHGIQSAIQWLSTNATSLDAIEKLGDNAIRKIVSKAVGKAFNLISPADLATVQKWAQKIVAEWNDLSAKLAAAAKFLKGQMGFDVSLEFSRVSEYSAVIDFEVDPANAAAVQAVQDNLARGNVQAMLAALGGVKAGGSGKMPYMIRESLLISRHLRTGVTTVLFTLLGFKNLQTVTGERLDESVVHVSNTGRDATFSGGFVQTVVVNNATNECGAWEAADASDDQLDPAKPFANVSRAMRLTFSRTDTNTSTEVMESLQTILEDLGFFVTAGTSLTGAAPAGAQTSFALDIALDEAAMAAFASDSSENDWNVDYRNAARRTISDPMVPDNIGGPLLVSVIDSDLFANSWTDTSGGSFREAYINAGRPTFGTRPVLDTITAAFVPPFLPIATIISRRPSGLRGLTKLAPALSASADCLATSLQKLSIAAADTFAGTSLMEWDDPMFNIWFVIARLVRLGGSALQNATGLATYRFRTDPTAAFSDPIQWGLTKGTGLPAEGIKARGVFPFS